MKFKLFYFLCCFLFLFGCNSSTTNEILIEVFLGQEQRSLQHQKPQLKNISGHELYDVSIEAMAVNTVGESIKLENLFVGKWSKGDIKSLSLVEGLQKLEIKMSYRLGPKENKEKTVFTVYEFPFK